jgi:hypothetical protein
MYSRARFKLDIDDKVIQAGRFDNKSTQEEQEEFLVRITSLRCQILSLTVLHSVLPSRPTRKRTRRLAT